MPGFRIRCALSAVAIIALPVATDERENSRRTAQQTATGPTGRACHAIANLPDSGVVVFGGAVFCGRDVVSDSRVWRWTRGEWKPFGVAFPGRREDALLAFDARRNVLMLYGGRAGDSVFADTWESNGQSWRVARVGGAGSPGGPGAVEHAAAAFDQRRATMVVFGGATRMDRRARNALWEWDGANWMEKSPAGRLPNGRIGASLVYSAQDGGVLLYGGFNDSGSLRDLWRWDGNAWTSLHNDGPTNTEGQALVASDSGVFVVGTGVSEAPPWERTLSVWRWRGGSWTRVGDGGPPGRVGSTVGYDAAAGQIVVFGGAIPNSPPTSETWTFDRSWRLAR